MLSSGSSPLWRHTPLSLPFPPQSCILLPHRTEPIRTSENILASQFTRRCVGPSVSTQMSGHTSPLVHSSTCLHSPGGSYEVCPNPPPPSASSLKWSAPHGCHVGCTHRWCICWSYRIKVERLHACRHTESPSRGIWPANADVGVSGPRSQSPEHTRPGASFSSAPLAGSLTPRRWSGCRP